MRMKMLITLKIIKILKSFNFVKIHRELLIVQDIFITFS